MRKILLTILLFGFASVNLLSKEPKAFILIHYCGLSSNYYHFPILIYSEPRLQLPKFDKNWCLYYKIDIKYYNKILFFLNNNKIIQYKPDFKNMTIPELKNWECSYCITVFNNGKVVKDYNISGPDINLFYRFAEEIESWKKNDKTYLELLDSIMWLKCR